MGMALLALLDINNQLERQQSFPYDVYLYT